MRFFKSLRILHHRSKSDPSLAPPKEYDARRRHSAPSQMTAFYTRSADDVFTAVAPASYATWSHPISIEQPQTDIRLPNDTFRRISELETEVAHLHQTIGTWSSEFAALKTELENVRRGLPSGLHEDVPLQQQDSKEILRLQERLVQQDQFIRSIVETGLDSSALKEAHDALRSGEGAEEALVGSIKEASRVPGNPWASLIPAVVGQRTQDEYLSALNISLKARQDLKDSQKIAKFWKRTALEDKRNADRCTPSVSNISSIHEVLSLERQTAVNELLARRASSHLVQPYLQNTAVACLPQSGSVGEIAAFAPDIGGLSILDTQSFDSFMVQKAHLLPLASESFKQELAAQVSSRSISRHLRGPFAQIDMNLSLSSLDSVADNGLRPQKIYRKEAIPITRSTSLQGRSEGLSVQATHSSDFRRDSGSSNHSTFFENSAYILEYSLSADKQSAESSAQGAKYESDSYFSALPAAASSFALASDDHLAGYTLSRIPEEASRQSPILSPVEEIVSALRNWDQYSIAEEDFSFVSATAISHSVTPPHNSGAVKPRLPVLRHLRRISNVGTALLTGPKSTWGSKK